MLTPDAAKERLALWRVDTSDDAEPKQLAAVKKLPIALRGYGYQLLGRDVDDKVIEWNPFTGVRTANRDDNVVSLDEVADPERIRLFEALTPSITVEVETTWQYLKCAPYQTGYARQSFRAPRHPEISLPSRISWLSRMADIAANFKNDIVTLPWLATWAPHFTGYNDGDAVGRLLAPNLSNGHSAADEVFDVLIHSARNEHEIGAMGRHVSRALLSASRPDGWEFVEKLLLAAQRHEGLRQTILETVDEAHPQAFRRMLRLIIEHDLARFSSVVRALNVWLGLAWDSVSVRIVNDTLENVLRLLDDAEARNKALDGKDAADAFLALWSMAFDDAVESVPLAERLLTHRSVDHRYVATLHLSRLRLPHADGALQRALADEDLRVAFCALSTVRGDWLSPTPSSTDSFEQLESLYARTPEKVVSSKPLVWPWTSHKLDREQVALCLFNGLGDRPPTRLIPFLPGLGPRYRAGVIEALSREKSWDKLTRETLVNLVGDSSSDVRQAAAGALGRSPLQDSEAGRVEGYLTRIASDLRRGVIGLLAKQADVEALASADRLLASKDRNQRLAGLELLRQLAEDNRQVGSCQSRAEAYRAARKKLTQDEETQLVAIAEVGREKITLENGLGLFDPAACTPVTPPQPRNVPFITDAAVACIKSLDDLIHGHRETPIAVHYYSGAQEKLLGTVEHGFPSPDDKKSPGENRQRVPLLEVWERWNQERPAELRDPDGMELARAVIWVKVGTWDRARWQEWSKLSPVHKGVGQTLRGGHDFVKTRYESLVGDVLEWLVYLAPPPNLIDVHLDMLESAFALIPPELHESLLRPASDDAGTRDDEKEKDWRAGAPIAVWLTAAGAWFDRPMVPPTPEQWARFWRLWHWFDQPIRGAVRSRPRWDVVLRASASGAANSADIFDQLLGPRILNRWGTGWCFEDLNRLTRLDLQKHNEDFLELVPELRAIANRCRDQIVALELSRGEEATAATRPALELGAVFGVDTLTRLLLALGKEGFRVESYWNYERRIGRAATLTALIAKSYPGAEENSRTTCGRLRQQLPHDVFTDDRALQLAFLAPQWVRHIEAYLEWPGFTEGLYWFIAHMKQASQATIQVAHGAELTTAVSAPAEESDEKKSSAWDRLIMERTPLTAEERQDGAVDVGWFQRTYAQLTPKRWQAMADAARFAATPQQAKQAQFVADVLLGKASRRELIKGIKAKRLKDYVRLFGLLPLASGAKRDADLAERYHVLQEYRRYAKQLSAMTKDSAMRAVEIGMRNLALTAGYADPLRLEWAMEAESVKDLARGTVEASKDGVTVSLRLDEQSRPVVSVHRGDKELKAIPPAVKKDKKIAALMGRVGDLKRQASRMRQSLESAMCRGDTFTGAELVQLCNHAVLAPLLERLVLIGDGIAGYPDKKGKALRDFRGKLEPVKKNESLRLAHPHDLLQTGKWDAWQHECFQAERVQPFKQIFRELYVVTNQEKADRVLSRRYAGQQVNPQQAHALWGQRGWTTKYGVWKTFYDQGMTTSVGFNYGVTTPLEVEGLTIILDQLRRQ